MLCHWRYVLDNLFGDVKSVSCLGATHIPKRWDENGKAYKADVDDAAYATFQLDGGIVAHINSSWCTRVRRDDHALDPPHGRARRLPRPLRGEILSANNWWKRDPDEVLRICIERHQTVV